MQIEPISLGSLVLGDSTIVLMMQAISRFFFMLNLPRVSLAQKLAKMLWRGGRKVVMACIDGIRKEILWPALSRLLNEKLPFVPGLAIVNLECSSILMS